MINRQTYEEYFLLYIDGELDAAQRAEVEQFVGDNPELKMELDMLGQSVFAADENIVFENKEILYKKENRAAVLFFSRTAFTRVAAAAAILILLAGGGWLYLSNSASGTRQPDQQLATTNNRQDVIQQNIPSERKSSVRPTVTTNAITPGNAPKNTNRKQSDAGRRTPQQRKALTTNGADHEQKQLRDPDAHVVDGSVDVIPEDITLKHDPVVMNDVAMTNYPDDGIHIPVKARSIADVETVAAQDNIRYAAEDDLSDDNRIYFANTSISRRNSLRVVFRKASRIIDRITTIQ